MKTAIIIGAISSTVALVGAQATFNPSTGTFTCPPGKSAFCASDSLVGNIIIRCTGTVGQPGNCDDNLAGVPPPGVKMFAPCWQCSPTSGNAACSYAGTVYPDSGSPFPVAQGDTTCNSTSSSPSSSNSTLTSSPTALPPITPAGTNAFTSSMSTTIIRQTTIATLVLPSSVPVAPGSGGYSNASSAVVGGETASVGMGSPTQFLGSGAIMPSSVPVAPGGGGFSYGYSNASSTPAAAMGTGSPTQSMASGGTSSPIATFTGSAKSLTSTRQASFAVVMVGLVGMWWCL